VGYELWKRQLDLAKTAPPAVWLHPKDNEPLANRNDLNMFFTRMENSLDSRNYQDDPARRSLCYRNIRNIFQRVITLIDINFT
jgi:tRNA C32,U32 (ribose-2'-O)-methylase TrmJ